jgi:predicted transcriptional regulator
MSPRAAWRLESLGFREVYEYRAGKADWLAAGLPTEGTGAQRKRIRDFLRTDVPTCRLDEKVGDVAARVAAQGWDMCLVVNDQNIVLGRLDRKELGAAAGEIVERAMRPGPSTYRPDRPATEVRHIMTHKGIGALPVTTGDGRLLGVLCREALEDLEDEVEEKRTG